jgi:hypothetical protein
MDALIRGKTPGVGDGNRCAPSEDAVIQGSCDMEDMEMGGLTLDIPMRYFQTSIFVYMFANIPEAMDLILPLYFR